MKLIFSFILFYHILLVQCALASTQPNGKLSQEENKILQQKCGHFDVNSAHKSINSERVQRSIAPWVVAVSKDAGHSNDFNITTASCSGTLISPRHVLAAKHCLLLPAAIRIWTKTDKVDNDTIEAFTKDRELVYLKPDKAHREMPTNLRDFRFVFHTDCGADYVLGSKTQCSTKDAIVRRAVKAFSPNTHLRDFVPGGSDLLIFELDEPVEELPSIYPACLADGIPSIVDVLDLYSFGMDQQEINESYVGMLQHISITIIPCLKLNSAGVICTRSNDQTTNIGDSGGGFIYKSNGISYVTAVVSGYANVTPNYFDFGQSAVAPHLAWICEHVGICADHTKTPQIRPEIEIIAIR